MDGYIVEVCVGDILNFVGIDESYYFGLMKEVVFGKKVCVFLV